MKIFDATALIAFLCEMDCPEGITEISKRSRIIIPEGIANEIIRPPGKDRLQDLARQEIVEIVKVDQAKTNQIMNENPQLHRGECEAIVFAQTHTKERDLCIVSDDSRARRKFQTLNFKWTGEILDTMKADGTISEDTYNLKCHRLQNSPFYPRRKKQ